MLAEQAQTKITRLEDSSSPSEDQVEALQAPLLKGVSRTFALTIPVLPRALYPVVANGYLLCRIIDTIEDEPALDAEQKRHFCHLFKQVTAGRASAAQFASALYPCLSAATLPAEHELIQQAPRVIDVLFSFNSAQRKALTDCVAIMSEGMAAFQQQARGATGLQDIETLNRYCYYVAGVVGEMLTQLFCDYSPAIARHRERMLALSVSFGQGLQMTNILKDIWDDLAQGRCWLPRDVFAQQGYDLDRLAPGQTNTAFSAGLEQLIGLAARHLANALEYVLLIPKQETGLRNFCLWALGMAVLTLRKINRHRRFSSGNEVKISRRSVKATVLTSRVTAGHDTLLRTLFRLSQLGQPAATPVPLPVPGIPGVAAATAIHDVKPDLRR